LSLGSKSRMLMAKRLNDDFTAYLDERNWLSDNFKSGDDVQCLIKQLGFCGIESPTDIKLLN